MAFLIAEADFIEGFIFGAAGVLMCVIGYVIMPSFRRRFLDRSDNRHA